MQDNLTKTAHFHLPGLFGFFDFYRVFLPIYREHKEFFTDNCDISSIYGAPSGCIWGGGRFGGGECTAGEVLALMNEYGISASLTFSNSLLRHEHLSDRKCNKLCRLFEEKSGVQNGIIVHSELLAEHLKKNYPGLYLVSSTTKVLTDFQAFRHELDREEFRFAVPDFRLNMRHDLMNTLTQAEKDKVEFLCNECCYIGCNDRKECYENVSRRILGENCPEHVCTAPDGKDGYLFSKAMRNPAFISAGDIFGKWLPDGFSNFKIEGRGLGSAVLLEFLLYYMVKPEFHINVREKIYLDTMLDLF